MRVGGTDDAEPRRSPVAASSTGTPQRFITE